ncbi:MAG: zf-HC2 domain-containing protein [Bacteroidetes bacterium]|nr:zf-HC2 domain-containing protein [Bacteroidota bacterium]
MKQMQCEDVRRLVGEGLNIERNSPTCLSVREHLSTCDDCREFVASLEKTIDCYRTYEIPKPENLDSLLKDTIDSITGAS